MEAAQEEQRTRRTVPRNVVSRCIPKGIDVHVGFLAGQSKQTWGRTAETGRREQREGRDSDGRQAQGAARRRRSRRRRRRRR